MPLVCDPSEADKLMRETFDCGALELAARLIGVSLFIDGVGGVIVETEAYTRDDPASHSFRGQTVRNAPMFGPPGTAYVYRSYGLHWCFNIVARDGGAVLLRALEPTAGLDRMRGRRGTNAALCAGPARLAQALGIDASYNAMRVDRLPFVMKDRTSLPGIVTGPRIGISRAREQPWRFGWLNSPYLSRPFSTANTNQQRSSTR